MKIKELAEKPREKALFSGVGSLSDTELLSLLIESGSKKMSAFELAMKILSESGGIAHLNELSLASLVKMDGIKEAKAVRLLAAVELARRIRFSKEEPLHIIQCAKDIYQLLEANLHFEKQEHFVALYCDSKHQIIRQKTLFVGSLNCSIVHPREVFKEALNTSAACVAVAHNHPSGDPTPSCQDIEITQLLTQTGSVMQIPLLDHVIIGHLSYFSFREAEML